MGGSFGPFRREHFSKLDATTWHFVRFYALPFPHRGKGEREGQTEWQGEGNLCGARRKAGRHSRYALQGDRTTMGWVEYSRKLCTPLLEVTKFQKNVIQIFTTVENYNVSGKVIKSISKYYASPFSQLCVNMWMNHPVHIVAASQQCWGSVCGPYQEVIGYSSSTVYSCCSASYLLSPPTHATKKVLPLNYQ